MVKGWINFPLILLLSLLCDFQMMGMMVMDAISFLLAVV
jgi:hypothetical protein